MNSKTKLPDLVIDKPSADDIRMLETHLETIPDQQIRDMIYRILDYLYQD